MREEAIGSARVPQTVRKPATCAILGQGALTKQALTTPRRRKKMRILGALMASAKRVLILVDHGSRLADAHAHLVRVARQVADRAPSLTVEIAHMELARPSLDEVIDACAQNGAEEVWVHPLFLAPGRHLTRDIPALIASAEARHPTLSVKVTDALGMADGLAELILSTVLQD